MTIMMKNPNSLSAKGGSTSGGNSPNSLSAKGGSTSGGNSLNSPHRLNRSNRLPMKTIASNKKAYFNYEILEEYIAGIKLEGREIKSIRSQKPSFAGSFVTISEGNAWLQEFNIPRYKYDSSKEYEPKRKRLLLLKRAEIERIEGKMSEQGVTVVPLELILERQWAKIKIGLVRGRKKYDKRRVIKEREEKRRMQRIIRKH